MKIFLIILFLSIYLKANVFLDDFYSYQANKFYEKKEYETTLKYLEKIENKNSKIFYSMGNILYIQGKYEEAIDYYEKVKDLELKHQINHNMANSYVKLQNYEKAIEFYKKALEYKNDEKTKYNLELIKLKKEEIDKENQRSLIKETCPVKSFGALVELHEDTIFDRFNFDEDKPMYKAKIDETKENIVSNIKSDDMQRDIVLDEKDNNIKSQKAKFELNPYFEQKWDKNIQEDSLKTLFVPLEKGVISDNKKPW
ncbi:tetratricopeptide repeat protein [Arcobacter cloacae]|uniref:Uncharacterized protein n=1 Tax=Arcobacter cloacae TaxID=1054034 RepID=A0A6M8NLX2_9BACT|nr:tetratricopeptide repeat protein [Arcobacter cloacae]QKF90210.1 tetratricopeptide repeat protein, putative oxygen tolerance protein BatC [Arcobacter cloacae]RXI41997.1 hypothetical protein CP963_05395 [Arcobacter cloacae]